MSENKIQPLCRTKKGCPIEDLAKDKELTRVVNGYYGARALMQYEHLNPLAIKELEKYGLTDPVLIIELENRVQKYLKSVREKVQNEAELKEQGKKGNLGGLA